MKILILALIVILLATVAYSDEIKIPFSCYPKYLQKDFAEKGIKLDLSPNDRTKDSWGFLESKGSSFSIYTYQSATSKDFELVREIVFKDGSCYK